MGLWWVPQGTLSTTMDCARGGPNAILKINPENGPNDNFMQLVVKTRTNQGIAAKQVVCINYGSSYDFTIRRRRRRDRSQEVQGCFGHVLQ